MKMGTLLSRFIRTHAKAEWGGVLLGLSIVVIYYMFFNK